MYTGAGGCSLVKVQTAITSGLFFLPEVPREYMPAEGWWFLEAEEGHVDLFYPLFLLVPVGISENCSNLKITPMKRCMPCWPAAVTGFLSCAIDVPHMLSFVGEATNEES